MTDTTTLLDVMPSATPSEREIESWQALPREEQVRRMKTVLSHPDCGVDSQATMADVRVEGQALAAKRRNG